MSKDGFVHASMNFIPVELRPKRPSSIPYLAVALVYVSALLFFGSRVPVVKRMKANEKEKASYLISLKETMEKYGSASAELENTLDRGMVVLNRRKALRGISESSMHWGSVLCAIGAVKPEELWFEELILNATSEEARVVGFGSGDNVQETVLAFVSELERSPAFKSMFSDIKPDACEPVEGMPNRERFVIVMSTGKTKG